MKKFFVTLIFTFVFAMVGVGVALYLYATTPGKTDNKVIFVVQPGSFSRVARELEAKGLIGNPRLLIYYARLAGLTDSVKVGEYELNSNMSPHTILSILISGKSLTYPLTIQEGLNIFEIAELLEQKGLSRKAEFLALCRNEELIRALLGEGLPSLEGYLFPNTYLFSKFTGTREIIREMVRQFLETYKEIEAGPQKVPLKRHQLVTLASIIEKETGVPEERGLVSSVFHNRLKKGMMLQTDPTVIYGLADLTGTVPRNITKTDLQTRNRYNTYTFRGLPYGPISNPGRDALAAAVNPDESEFLYFVSRNDGTHVFSSSYEQHNSAVRKYQLDRRQRQGKSWRQRK